MITPPKFFPYRAGNKRNSTRPKAHICGWLGREPQISGQPGPDTKPSRGGDRDARDAIDRAVRLGEDEARARQGKEDTDIGLEGEPVREEPPGPHGGRRRIPRLGPSTCAWQVACRRAEQPDLEACAGGEDERRSMKERARLGASGLESELGLATARRRLAELRPAPRQTQLWRQERPGSESRDSSACTRPPSAMAGWNTELTASPVPQYQPPSGR